MKLHGGFWLFLLVCWRSLGRVDRWVVLEMMGVRYGGCYLKARNDGRYQMQARLRICLK